MKNKKKKSNDFIAPKKKKKSQGFKSKSPSKKVKKNAVLSAIEKIILNYLKKHNEKEFGSRDLIKKTGIKDKDAFYKAINNLESYGKITVVKHKVKILSDSVELKGELVSLAKGFGFVRPESGEEDIFIHGSELNNALVGDKVLVGKVKQDAKGYSGVILKVLEEAKEFTTGTVVKGEYGLELIPDNKLRYNLDIVRHSNANVGEKVMARIVQDDRGDWTRAIVTQVFGNSESARVCSDAIIEQHGIPNEFSKEVLELAEEINKNGISNEDLINRLDLRDAEIFTIDGADAKDLDDAISIRRIRGGWELGVHIADVAHYIQKGTALDAEAMERGTSVYFADRVIPMLPEAISNGVCSLTSNTDKLCFSAIMRIDNDGNITKYDFKKTVINSKVRGVYSEVNMIFDKTASTELKEKYAPVEKSLKTARKLALLLKEKSCGRGTMQIESTESRFVLDENGVCVGVSPRGTGEAQELIEQFMISANVCAAKFSKDKVLPFLYRVHESPDTRKIGNLLEFLKALNIEAKELKKEKPNTADFSAVLNRLEGTKQKGIVSDKVLRTMEKARYSTEALGHFGLNLSDYSHFTSPIRRYPDTSIHRIMTAFVEGASSAEIEKKYKKFCAKSAEQSSACEIRAVIAQRETEDCYMAEFMANHLGETFKGEVSSVLKVGVFVRLENSVEGFIPIENFRNNYFEFDGIINHKCRVTGRVLTIGDELEIRVAKAVVATGKIDFVPVEPLAL